MSGHEALRLSHQGRPIAVPESFPDGVLPASVEGFDVGLKSPRQRRSKHRRDLQRQAHPDHSTKRVRPWRTSLKDGGMIELRVPGKAHFPPMIQPAIPRDLRGDLFDGPHRTPATVEAGAGQHVHFDSAANDHVFNAVEVVDVGPQGGDIRQVSTSRWSLVSDSLATIQRTSPRQDSREGGHRRNRSRTTLRGCPKSQS